jgi:hypothetical protein
MFILTAGSPSRLLYRQIPFHCHSPRRSANLSLFTRVRFQGTAAHTQPVAEEEEAREHLDAGWEQEIESASAARKQLEDNGRVQPMVDDSKPSLGPPTNQTDAIQPLENQESASRRTFNQYRSRGVWHLKPANKTDEESVILGTAALGQPSTIRIVREQKWKKKSRPKLVVNPPTAEADIGPDELEDLALIAPSSDAGPEEIDAVMNKFHEEFLTIRQPDGSYLRRHCLAVAEKLFDGLTHEQLEDYLDRHEQSSATSIVDDLDRYHRSDLIVRARWFSETSPFPKTARLRLDRKEGEKMFHERDFLSVPKANKRHSLSGKQKIVERILRQLWLVRAQDELALGELDFQVNNWWHFKTLLNNRKYHCSLSDPSTNRHEMSGYSRSTPSNLVSELKSQRMKALSEL